MTYGKRTRRALGLAGFLAMAAPALPAAACAVCGCGAGGYYLGLLPLYQRNYVGLRYRTAAFNTHDPMGPAGYEALSNSKEYFQTVEAVARVYLAPRLMAQAYLPYQFHAQQTSAGVSRTQGVGDALAFLSYKAFSNLSDTGAPALRHALWVGVGLKTATGRYRAATPGEVSVANAGFMLGTGSWDPMALVSYQVRRGRTGLAADVSVRYATVNKEGYQFGDRLTASLAAFTIRQGVGWGVMPSAGAYLETSNQDWHNGHPVDMTGGTMLAAQAGLDFFAGSWTAGVIGQLPVTQHLAGGSQQALPRLMAQVGWAF